MRHAESLANIGKCCGYNSELSELGIKQATNLYGEYDLVIMSPLKRCIQTLAYSKIKYNNVEINHLVREVMRRKESFLENEKIIYETDEDVSIRIKKFKKLLQNYSGKILVVTHSHFIWHLTSKMIDDKMMGIDPSNATIIEYVDDVFCVDENEYVEQY